MPIYEYRCTKCGKEFEELVCGPKDEPRTCPACGAQGPERRLSGFARSEPRPLGGVPAASGCGGGGKFT